MRSLSPRKVVSTTNRKNAASCAERRKMPPATSRSSAAWISAADGSLLVSYSTPIVGHRTTIIDLKLLNIAQQLQTRRLGTVKHIRLNFIALAASKDVVVQALAVIMGFNDCKSQTVPAYWTHHFRDNRARRLLS